MEKHRLENAKSPYCWSCQCLALLSGMSRRKPKLQAWKRQIPILLKLPVPSVALWNVKKKAKTTVGMEKHRLENAKSPYCWSCQCLALLCGMSRRKPKLRWGWRNTGLETPNPHTAEAASAIQCLALLCGMSRRKAKTTVGMKKPRLGNAGLESDGRWNCNWFFDALFCCRQGSADYNFICDPPICWNTPRSRQFWAATGSNTSIAVGALWAVDWESGHQQGDASIIFLRQWRQWEQTGG